MNRLDPTSSLPMSADLQVVGSARSGLSCSLYSARNKRRYFFDKILFSEPAWDMLLVLHCAESTGKDLPISSVARAGDGPYSTGLRWLAVLEDRGLVHRTAHPSDARSSLVALTEAGRASMEHYFERLSDEEFQLASGAL